MEESKFDKVKAMQVVRGIETLLASWFSVLTNLFVSKQLEAVKQAIAAGEADLSTKCNSVLTAFGSLASCTSLICLFLGSMANGALDG